jgi:TolB-like protein
MLTGSRAFDRPTAAECLSAIIREDPRPLSRLNPSVPPPVRWIVERCLAKQPRDRYTSTRDLARDLMSAREHLTELLAFARARRHGRAPGHVSLAVLPFASFSLQPAQALFAEAMTEAVIVELTHRDLLHVTSRMSSLVYRDQRRALPEIAAELAVGWIVQGSVMHHRKRLRVTAQLVHAATDENRWGRTFDCEASDLLTVQAEVAAAIADDIHGVVRREAETPLEEEPERFEVMA